MTLRYSTRSTLATNNHSRAIRNAECMPFVSTWNGCCSYLGYVIAKPQDRRCRTVTYSQSKNSTTIRKDKRYRSHQPSSNIVLNDILCIHIALILSTFSDTLTFQCWPSRSSQFHHFVHYVLHSVLHASIPQRSFQFALMVPPCAELCY